MKKIILASLFIIGAIFFTSCAKENSMVGMPNPWQDFSSTAAASKMAGFQFPLDVKNPSVRAMKGMMEVTYKTSDNRELTIRKSENVIQIDGHDDISGVYTKYPVNKEITLSNEVPMYIRGDKDKIYVINMAAEDGYFSAYCPQGMSYDETETIYQMLAKAHEKIEYK